MKNALTRAEIVGCIKTAKRITAGRIVLYVHQNNTPLRFAVLIAKKYTPLATKRNYIKRICREEIRSKKTLFVV